MQRIGSSYVLRTPIGRGSSGQVWSGTTVDSGRAVAIKVLSPELAADPQTVARFVQERSILTGLRSSHLVQVRDLVVEGGTLAIVMDLVPGVDLRQHLRRVGALAPGLAAELIGQVLSALAVVHRAGIVHRDVKPENILLDLADAARPRALLTDFGIARIVAGADEHRSAPPAGTLRYLAPEVARSGDARAASDLYSTGVVLYELLTGRPPFEATEPFTLMRAHELEQPAPIAGLPDGLRDVLERLLAKTPAGRPASAAIARQQVAAAAVEARSWTALPSVGEADLYDGPTIPPGILSTVSDLDRSLPEQALAPAARSLVAGSLLAGSRAAPSPAAPAWWVEPADWVGEDRFGEGTRLLGNALTRPGPPPPGPRRPGDGADPTAARIPADERGDRRLSMLVAGLFVLLLIVGGIAAAAFWPSGNPSRSAALPPVIPTMPPPSDPGLVLPTTAATAGAPAATPAAAPTTTASAARLVVPPVIGMLRSRAVIRLRVAGVSTIRITEQCVKGARPDRVVRQQPAPGAAIPAGDPATVALVVQDPDCRTVPDVTGETVSTATMQLRAEGFTDIRRLGGGGRGLSGQKRVVAQTPAAGTSVLRSTPVVLQVATDR